MQPRNAPIAVFERMNPGRTVMRCGDGQHREFAVANGAVALRESIQKCGNRLRTWFDVLARTHLTCSQLARLKQPAVRTHAIFWR